MTALASLPNNWQDWIAGNLARSCDASEMAEIMVRDGHFELSLARAAIAQARDGTARPTSPVMCLPDITCSTNSIIAVDRKIDILLTLTSPRIVLLGNVLSSEECDALTSYCQPRLERSPVVNDRDGSTRAHEHRTSKGCMLERAETELVARIEARLAHLAHWPVDHGEGLQLQQYQPSNEYRPHFDWFDPNLPGPRKHMEHGGQRLATFVLYLSEVERGGGTAFPTIGLDILPTKGSAVFFQNTDAHHIVDRRTLHAGSPVVRGVKTIANKWLRATAY
jgi:prolyl 4-hydroxylase